MKGKSHHCLGQYLVRHYMNHVPNYCKKAFLIGCMEPDRNPTTYLKGSIRCQWLRGHNYLNAIHFMRHISRRLENKKRFRVWDYYTLGKLIHYIADSFTYAHNDTFSQNLAGHREYESLLQDYFLTFIENSPQVNIITTRSVMESVYKYHIEYENMESGTHTDSYFVLAACCCALTVLFPNS